MNELRHAAMELRQRLLKENKDPLSGVFHVTQAEKMALCAEPPFNDPYMDAQRLTLCGLKLKLI